MRVMNALSLVVSLVRLCPFLVCCTVPVITALFCVLVDLACTDLVLFCWVDCAALFNGWGLL